MNGAQLETVNLAWERPSPREVFFGSKAELCLVDEAQQPMPNVLVGVQDCRGSTVFAGRTDETGCEMIGFSERDFHNLASGGGSLQIDTCGWSTIQIEQAIREWKRKTWPAIKKKPKNQQEGGRVYQRVDMPWPESLVLELNGSASAGGAISSRRDSGRVRQIVR